MVKIIIFIISLTLIAIIFQNPFKLGVQDWDLYYAYAQANNISYLQYQQIPLWNPYHCGGITQLGNIVSLHLTPFYIPILIFGPVLGYKFQLLIYILIGFLGTFKFAKVNKISKYGSLFISLVYVLSGLFFAPYSSGMPVFLPLMLIPILYLFLQKSFNAENSLKPAILVSFISALIFLSGYHYIVELIFFILVTTLIQMILKRDLYYFRIFVFILIFFLAFSAVKAFPVLEKVLAYPRYIPEKVSGYSLITLSKSLLWPIQDLNSFYNWGIEKRNLISGVSYNIDENSIYIGLFPFLFFVFGLINIGLKNKVLILTLLIFFWLSLGLNINPSLYYLLKKLPFFDVLRVAQRYRFYMMIPLILFIGFGFDQFLKYLRRKFNPKANIIKLFICVIILISAIDLLQVDYRLLQTFNINLPKVKHTPFFQQRNDLNYYDKEGFKKNMSNTSTFSDEYPYLLAGWGSAKCYESQPSIRKTLSFDHPDFKGEYYLRNGNGSVIQDYWSPNKIILKASLKADDQIILNQNYDPGWKINVNGKRIEVFNKNGLISSPLAKGNSEVIFYYLPDSYRLGLFISLTSLLLFLIYFTFF